jgi:hypothetical protein
MPVSISGTNGVTFPDSSLQAAAASPYVLKNRIINGAMTFDQRNAGAATANTINDYTVDRWQVLQSVTGKLIAQQNAAAVTPPTGFTNYLGVTSQSNYSVLTGDYYIIRQSIEGYNVADLGFGTANAKTITLSFWVRSSLTGTFGGALQNSGSARSYPFSYTISSANTWEQKTITIAGDTSGTWLTTNGVGLIAQFGLGVGSTFSGTAGAWASANYVSATGATSVVGTNGATFYITGVQLEQNTTATPFERRLYNQELANCQRYYAKTTAGTGAYTAFGMGVAGTTTSAQIVFKYPQSMRASPTLGQSLTSLTDGSNAFSVTGFGTSYIGQDTANGTLTVASGLTQFRAYQIAANNSTSAYVDFSAEL